MGQCYSFLCSCCEDQANNTKSKSYVNPTESTPLLLPLQVTEDAGASITSEFTVDDFINTVGINNMLSFDSEDSKGRDPAPLPSSDVVPFGKMSFDAEEDVCMSPNNGYRVPPASVTTSFDSLEVDGGSDVVEIPSGTEIRAGTEIRTFGSNDSDFDESLSSLQECTLMPSDMHSADSSEQIDSTQHIDTKTAIYELDEVFNDPNILTKSNTNGDEEDGRIISSNQDEAGLVVSSKEELHPDDFSSYSALKDYTIARLKAIGLTESLCNNHPHDYVFFRALFQRHPTAEEKKTAQITDIRIRLFPKAKGKRNVEVKDYQMHIVTADGGEDTISWVKSMRQEDYSPEKKLRTAMREAIRDQMRDFRAANATAPCALCGSRYNMSIDHIKHFEELCNDFVILYPNYPIEYNKNDIRVYIFRPEDAEYESLWKGYHLANATLQMACVRCNQGRPMWVPPTPLPEKRWKPVGEEISESKASDEDIRLTCKDCKAPFMFPKQEQELFASKQYPPPIRCKDCIMKKNKKSKRSR